MPRTSVLNQDKVKEAIVTLIWAPVLTVLEAMIVVKFTEDESNTKLMQRKVT
jgi:hypothetical protein